MTYTIIARDPDTGHFGIAVQTFNLAVGTWVPWAAGGVGAVATQALAERSYGHLGLDLMRGGHSATEALTALLTVDSLADARQVGMIDMNGDIAVHTGSRCMPEAGTRVEDGFATLANMMLRDTVWDAMAAAYSSAEGDFPARLMAALHAAQAEGGDMRGKQTAAMLIVDSVHNPIPILDLRVDHDEDPLRKLEALLRLHRGYMAEYELADQSRQDALRHIDLIESEAPDEEYLRYLIAMHKAARFDQTDEAITELRDLIAQNDMWLEYLRREARVDNFGIPGLGSKLLTLLKENPDGASNN